MELIILMERVMLQGFCVIVKEKSGGILPAY
jgi:hypothetical protein